MRNRWTRRLFDFISTACRRDRKRRPTRGRIEPLERRELLSIGADEQFFLYTLNRARHDPGAYCLEQNLSLDLWSVTPRGPLAPNDQLFASAGDHAEEMAAYDYLGYQSPVTGDFPNKMVRDHGYELPKYWTQTNNYVESQQAGTPYAQTALNRLLDQKEGRWHLMSEPALWAPNREAGVGHGYNRDSTYEHYWTIHIARHEVTTNFLTGVVFNDANGNLLYDQGEGLSGVTVTAGGQSTTTNPAGGWSLALPAGTYSVSTSGGQFTGTATASATITDDNVEVDFVSGRAAGIVDFAATAVPLVTFSTASQYVSESAGAVTLTVALSAASTEVVRVPFSLSGTATGGGVAYAVDPSPLVIPAGATTGAITLTIVNDAAVEAEETVILTLGTPDHAALGPIAQHTLTIRATPGLISDVEQHFVYLLNRARHDPVAYQQEQSLPVDLSYVTPRGPLAVNEQLFASAGFHAEEMATYGYFSHQSTVTGDWPNKMARDQGYPLPEYFGNDANYIESLAGGTDYSTAISPLDGLIVDSGVSPPGHRNHLLGITDFHANCREIGVGEAYCPTSLLSHMWAIHATWRTPDDRFLTGVAFNDANHNQRYDEGEGLAGVTITAAGKSTTTNRAGGWSLQVPEGNYTVAASGSGFVGTASAAASVSNDNVEVDFISGCPAGSVDFAAVATSADTPGLYVADNSAFFLNEQQAGGDAEHAFTYGVAGAGWMELVGDWNGDGQDTPGFYDPATATFYLTDRLEGGDATYTFQFGIAGQNWKPLVGDWDGNGHDSIAIYEPATSLFFFKNTLAGGDADEMVQFGVGSLGWIPIAGDWDGIASNGDGFGFYEPAISAFWLKNARTPGPAEECFQFGMGSLDWTVLAGNWDGLPGDGVGFYVPETGQWFLKNEHAPGPAEVSFTYGIGGAGWRPLVGCWQATAAAAPAVVGRPSQAAVDAAAIDQLDLAALAAQQLEASVDDNDLGLLFSDAGQRRGRNALRR